MNFSTLMSKAKIEISPFKDVIVDFVKKGAKRRETRIKIKDLTEARLKKIPNYIAVEVAKQKINLTKDAMIVGLLSLVLILTYSVVTLASKMDERIVALIPSRIERATEVEPNKISPAALYSKISSIISLLGNIDHGNVEFNYEVLKTLMADDLKVKFWADSTQLRKVVKDKSMSQTISYDMKDMSVSSRGKQLSALIKVKIKPMYGDEIGKIREEYILVEGTVVVKKEDNFWEVEIFNLEQGPVSDIAQVKRRIEGSFE